MAPGVKRSVSGAAQMRKIVRNEVSQVAALGVVTEGFDRVEFGGTGWQPLDFEPPVTGRAAGGLAVDAPAVPDENQRTPS